MTKLISTVFPLAVLIVLGVSANAQAPAQTMPAKVGLVNTEAFSSPTGGVTRLVNAIKSVDVEFKSKRDDIAQRIARLNSLQQVPPGTPQAQIQQRREQAETLQIEIQRLQEDARAAYTRRMAAVTNPKLAIVRLHGRRAATWEGAKVPTVERYRYLYSAEELEPWVDRIEATAKHAVRTVVLQNNCYGTYGTTNAREMLAMLAGD